MCIRDSKYANISNKQLSFITQTTLSVDDTKDIIAALKSKFPDIKEPKNLSLDLESETTNEMNQISTEQLN